MKRFISGLLLVLPVTLLCALALLPIQAQAKKGKKYALLVGITEYKNAALPALKYTENDVEELAAIMQAKASGFDEVRILSVTRAKKDKKDEPTAANILKAIDALVRKKERHDTIVIGLSGHGVQLTVKDPDGKSKPKSYPYFCPVEADFLDVSYSTGRNDSLILLDDLFAKVGQCGATNRLVLIDACRNEVDVESATRNVDVEQVSVPKGVGVLFSCRSGEKAWETKKLGKGHGVFFYHVAQGLMGKARNTRDQVTWDSLASYVRTEVSAVVPDVIGQGAEQTPHGILNLDSLPVLAVIAKGAPKVRPPVKEEVVKGTKGKTITNSIGMELAYIPKGKFSMGSPSDEKDRYENEGPEHDVEITKPFYLGVYEVTQGEYEKVMEENPSYFSKTGKGKLNEDTSRFPVESVSYEDAKKFCVKLSGSPKEKEKNHLYRLPSEAEWEYACRGGASSKTPVHFGQSLSSDQANFNGNNPFGGASKNIYLKRTCTVGSYKPNGFGLYDMHGNVWEWCSDWYDKDSYSKSRGRNPGGPSEGSRRVIRGGSWINDGGLCRSALRYWRAPRFRDEFRGFRVALVPFGE